MTDDMDNAGSDLGGENEVARAFEIIKQAMIDDGPEPGSYAHTWHCNIAMACFDAVVTNPVMADNYALPHSVAHAIGNNAASRFMKLCFDVDTQA